MCRRHICPQAFSLGVPHWRPSCAKHLLVNCVMRSPTKISRHAHDQNFCLKERSLRLRTAQRIGIQLPSMPWPRWKPAFRHQSRVVQPDPEIKTALQQQYFAVPLPPWKKYSVMFCFLEADYDCAIVLNSSVVSTGSVDRLALASLQNQLIGITSFAVSSPRARACFRFEELMQRLTHPSQS
jgi:hypothetical protein